ncbi:MAG TPA: DUF4351 domain-containing protein [Thermoanaerobaculia bacterium]|nr:DUF4351 domain-containing protein [Thermoanaerobaculia bacterium]
MPPHDRLFKTILRAFFADLLRLAAPAVARQALLAKIAFLDKELLTGADRREADLLARVPLRSGGSLLVHVEVEARARPRMPRRLRTYASRIQASYDGQVLSLVLYIRGGEPGVCWQELDGEVRAPEVTSFRYVAFGLAGCRAAEYLARPEPLAWGLAAVMDPGPLSRIELRLACLQRIGGAKLSVERRGLLADFVDAYLPLTPEEEEEYKIAVGGKPKETRAMFMTWSERLRAEGVREGRREALKGVLLRLLEKRFGSVPQKALQKIESLKSVPRLTELCEQVLTASSLKELGLLR